MMSDFKDYWNAIVKEKNLPWPGCDLVSKKRTAALGQRVKEDKEFLAHAKKAIDIISVSPWYLGENGRGWLPTIDFILMPDKVTKILERGYGNSKLGQKKSSLDAQKSGDDWLSRYGKAADAGV
jgi:hypothetical protein